MANYDFLFPFESKIESWLTERGYPHPQLCPGNRFPTKDEVLSAIAAIDSLDVERSEDSEFFAVKKGTEPLGQYLIRIACKDWKNLGQSDDDSIAMHGDFSTELILLEKLSHVCGQLLLYPDTGAPAVIVERNLDTRKVEELWTESLKHADCWKHFYCAMDY